MGEHSEVFVAFDTAKLKRAVALAEGGRDGEARFVGEIGNRPAAIEKLVKELARLHRAGELTAIWVPDDVHEAVRDLVRGRTGAGWPSNETVRDIAWKAQLRLCGRNRRLNAAGKKLPVIIATIAREMAVSRLDRGQKRPDPVPQGGFEIVRVSRLAHPPSQQTKRSTPRRGRSSSCTCRTS